MAESVATTDELKYLRKYPSGPVYAPLTGYYSLVYGKSELEKAEDEVLSGSDPRLFGSRIADILTGRSLKGGSVNLTINNAAQQAAFQGLGNRRGAVVALDPTTGAILAAASSPSYDPNTLSSHNTEAIQQSWQTLLDDKNQPLLNRALNQSYPPGSIFKVVVSRGRAQGRQEALRPHPGAGRADAARNGNGHDAQLQQRAVRRRQDRHSRPRASPSPATPPSASSASTSVQQQVEAEAELFGMNNRAPHRAARRRSLDDG